MFDTTGSGASASAVSAALLEITHGKPVVLERPDRGADLVLAGELAGQRNTAFLVAHTSGLLSVALPESRCDELQLPPMITSGTKNKGSGTNAVSVDAAEGGSTGISARDRARTIRLLAADSSRPQDFRRPGHVLPLRAHPGGVLRRAQPAEASLDLCRLARLQPAGLRSELLREDGEIPSSEDVHNFTTAHGLARLSIEHLVTYRRAFDLTVCRVAEWPADTEHGRFQAIGFRCAYDDTEHVALVAGDPGTAQAPLIRVYRECLHCHVFGALDCSCVDELQDGLRSLARSKAGVLIYLRSGATLAWPHTRSNWQHVDRDPVATAMVRALGIEHGRMRAA